MSSFFSLLILAGLIYWMKTKEQMVEEKIISWKRGWDERK